MPWNFISSFITQEEGFEYEPEVDALGESEMVGLRMHWFVGLESRGSAREMNFHNYPAVGVQRCRSVDTGLERLPMSGSFAILENSPTEPDSGFDVWAAKTLQPYYLRRGRLAVLDIA